MLTAGDEMGRTQQGNNNAYCQDNEVSWVDWDGGTTWSDLHRAGAIGAEAPPGQPGLPPAALLRRPRRRCHGGRKDLAWFGTHGNELERAEWWQSERRVLGMFLAGDAIRSRHRDGSRVTGDSFLLWFNAAEDDVDVTLPDHGYWAQAYEVLLDTASTSESTRRCDAGGTHGLSRPVDGAAARARRCPPPPGARRASARSG